MLVAVEELEIVVNLGENNKDNQTLEANKTIKAYLVVPAKISNFDDDINNSSSNSISENMIYNEFVLPLAAALDRSGKFNIALRFNYSLNYDLQNASPN